MDKLQSLIRDLKDGEITVRQAKDRISFMDWEEARDSRRSDQRIVRALTSELDIDEYIKFHSRSPEAVLIERENLEETIQLINLIMSWLTRRQKRVFWMYVIEKRNQDQIARALGVSQPSVSMILNRIFGRIHEKCYKNGRKFDNIGDLLHELQTVPY